MEPSRLGPHRPRSTRFIPSHALFALSAFLLTVPLTAQQPNYLEGSAVPRSMTPAEAQWVAANPLGGRLNATLAPTGLVHCVAEYEAMDGILIVWEGSTAATMISNQGASMSRVFFPVRATDTIWIRDYGPRYIFQGDVRAIVDHTYNRPRPNDNSLSSFFFWLHGACAV